MSLQTAERVSSHDASDNVIFQRHLVAYREASKLIGGKVLEVGCGEGYGIAILALKAQEYVAIDKFQTNLDDYKKQYKNIRFMQANVPPFPFEDNTFDALVTFQVIEHIEEDEEFVSEMYRVLKPKGTLVLTTPNIKMSLTRNPWHVREYTAERLTKLLARFFSEVDMQGVYGNEKVMKYYEKNKASVDKIKKLDILDLQYRLPRRILQIPYDIMNRLNRRFLLNRNKDLVAHIQAEDYFVKKANDLCFDLLAIAKK